MHQERDASYNHVLKYTGIFGGVQGLNIIINLVRNKLVALLLGPDGMGLASLFNTTVNFISQSTNLGISFSAVKHISSLYEENDEEKMAHFVKVVRGWSLITALVGMAICVLIGPLLSDYTFSWGDHTLHFILLSPAVGHCIIDTGLHAVDHPLFLSPLSLAPQGFTGDIGRRYEYGETGCCLFCGRNYGQWCRDACQELSERDR